MNYIIWFRRSHLVIIQLLANIGQLLSISCLLRSVVNTSVVNFKEFNKIYNLVLIKIN